MRRRAQHRTARDKRNGKQADKRAADESAHARQNSQWAKQQPAQFRAA
jgi:hypothetical protein